MKPEYKNKQEAPAGQDKLVRITSKDIAGNMTVYSGLTKIKGVSWAVSNAICNSLNIEKNKKIVSLTESEIKKIEDFLKNPSIPNYILNRRNDFETGLNRHIIGTGMDLQREFDIKRLKKIKSYRGIRHVAGLTVRGQRTRAHFRKNRRKSTGVKKKAKPQQAAAGQAK